MTTEANAPAVELSELAKPEPVDVITGPVSAPEKTEEETAKADAESKAAEEAKAKPPEDAKITDGVQKRFDELTKARRSAEREAEYWKGIASQKAQDDKEPTPDQFENYDAYIKALATHAAKAAVSSAATATASQHVRTAEDSIWASKLAETQSQIPDYQTIVAASDQEVAPHVVEAIRAAELGPALVYHLAKNPELAVRLNGLSPVGAAIELGRIEATLGKPPREVEVPPKPASNAPDPIKPIAAPRNTTVSLETAEMDDYVKARRKQGARF